ncbi:16112_t:CDS:2, partial [Gigaspora margarita]
HVDLAAWVKEQFNLEVHSTTIGRLVKNKDDIGDNPSKKRQRTVQYPDLENALLEWILQNQNKIIISDTILIEKHREDASVDDNVVAVAIPQLREVLKEYELKDIYNMDKTELFYRLEPDTTLATT